MSSISSNNPYQPNILINGRSYSEPHRINKSSLKRLVVLVVLLLFFLILLFLIFTLAPFKSLYHSKGKDYKNVPNVSSQDVVSLNEENRPLESHNLKFKSTWKGWDHTVILISLDGFRFEYLSRTDLLPTLTSLRKESSCSKMHPVFPSITFPNHFSMVTGVYPDIHGIVNNVFYDPKLKDFFNYKKPSIKDSKWWKANPIWNVVQDHGLSSAVSFWPGSDSLINGNMPTHVIRYQDNYDDKKHIDDLLKWIDYPPSIRPSFMASYFPLIDVIGHLYGPDSKELSKTLKETDSCIGYLVSQLKSRNIYDSINLIIVSDHGMSKVNPKHIINAEDIFPLNLTHSIDYGPVAYIRPLVEDYGNLIYDKLLNYSKEHGHFKVYFKSNLPKEWNYGNSDRIAPIIIICEPSYYFNSRSTAPPPLGAHGYPLPNDDMEAIFMAHGKKIRTNTELIEPYSVLNPCSCLDLFPFTAKLLGLQPPKSNGTNYLVDTLIISP